jgi:sugar/nucleoside kinase (ribokinase family)
MPVKLPGRYEPGSDKDRAHRLLKEAEVEVDHVYRVDTISSGATEITFTFDGHARTAFVENDVVVHVTDGWDVPPPKATGRTWRGGY